MLLQVEKLQEELSEVTLLKENAMKELSEVHHNLQKFQLINNGRWSIIQWLKS